MKTSNIILLILAISVPAFLFTYNYLLKEQYLAGNLSFPSYNQEAQYQQRELPVAQHIVLDSELKVRDLKVKNGMVQGTDQIIEKTWDVQSDGNQEKATIKFPKLLEDIVKTRLVNDTLYITLEKDKVNENTSLQLSRMGITARIDLEISLPAVQSFTLLNGNCNFEATHFEHGITLTAKNTATLQVNNTHVDQVQAVIDHEAHLEFLQNNTIANLEYALHQQAYLGISDQSNFGQLHQTFADSLSQISITARASELQQQLAKVVGGNSE